MAEVIVICIHFQTRKKETEEDDDDVQRVSSNLELTVEVAEALEQL